MRHRIKTHSIPVATAAAFAAFALLAPGSAKGQTLLFENFEGLELGPNVDEALAGAEVWTKTGPEGWVSDDSGVPGVGTDLDGVTEWAGWSFANKDWWNQTAGDQRRSEYSRGSGTVMIADPDEWDDAGHADSAANGWYDTFISTASISIAGLDADSVIMIFDSSWRPEFDSNFQQTGQVTVSYDGAEEQEILLWSSDSSQPPWTVETVSGFKDDNSTNERIILPLDNPAGASDMAVTFGLFEAGNDWWWAIDNVAIGVPPLITGIDVLPIGFTIRITDAMGRSVDTSKGVKLVLDEEEVEATAVEKIEDDTLVKYLIAPDFFVPNSTHTVRISFTNNLGEETDNTLTFKVGDFPVLGPELKMAEGAVNKSMPGFSATVNQSPVAHGNTRDGAERQLDGRTIDPATGQPAENLASSEGAEPDGTFSIEDYVNWEQRGADAGNFNAGAEPPNDILDDLIPGVPGITSSDDNVVAEMIAFLELDRGAYRFGVNSDDGFVVTAGRNAKDQLSAVLGIGAGGNALFDFAVEEAGIYALRLLWWQGGDGSSVEFFSVDYLTGEMSLVNDRSRPGAIDAYREGPNPSYVDWVSPGVGATAAPADTAIEFKVVGGDDTVDGDSLRLSLDGQAVDADVQSGSGGSFTATWTPSDLLASGSTHTAELTYSAGGDPITGSWTFTVVNYATLPAALGTALGTGEERGMKWRTHQLDVGRGNSIALAEQQLAGELGEDFHDTFDEGEDGFFDIDFVNFEQGGSDAGHFTASEASPQDVLDEFFPGIPGFAAADTDNIATECFAFIEFTEVGLHQMVVNSDDGFEVTMGNRDEPKFLSLGKFDGGRGSADTLFLFRVETPGVYLFRLMWFEGDGGANVEWFSVNPDGSRALVNGTQTGSLEAFRSRSVDEPGLPDDTPLEFTGIEIDGGNVVVSWTGDGTLEESENLTDWTTVEGATSPFSTPAGTKTINFYRLTRP